MVPKLTVDQGLLRENVLLPSVLTLKTWESEGKIEIFESDRAKETNADFNWPGAQPIAKPRPRFRTIRKPEAGGVSFQKISAVLFPNRDPNRLTMTEVNDVAHLQRHHSLGHSIFVTTNAPNFIVGGKRERLQAAFKIVILTPEETVVALKASQSWAEVSEKRGAV